MLPDIETIFANLRKYKRKFYLNQLLKGSIFFLSVLLGAYLIFNTLEYFGNFNTYFRTVFFFSFLAIALILGYSFVIIPIIRIVENGKKLPDEEAAVQIGNLIPQVKDKLLNTLQLYKFSNQDNDMIKAGIAQKTEELSVFKFSKVINLKENKRFLPFLIPPVTIIAALLIFIPQLFTEGTSRIIKYNEEFIPAAPFQFFLENNSLETFKNEDLELKLNILGNALPEVTYIEYNGRKHKMEKIDESHYTFIFKSIDKSINFKFLAANFYSKNFEVILKSRPILNQFDLKLDYPNYINKKSESLSNIGNLIIPEGTIVTWIFDTEDSDELNLNFNNAKQKQTVSKKINNGFEVRKQIFKSDIYTIALKNKFGTNKEKIEYSINVIADEYPKITVQQYRDTVLYNYLALGGNVSDDYGITDLKLFYKKTNIAPVFSFTSDFVEKTPNSTQWKTINLKFDKAQKSQSFYFRWEIDSLNMQPGEVLEYHVAIWDNDAVNGNKSTKSQSFELRLPTQNEIQKSIAESSNNAEKQISTTLNKADELKKDVKKLEQKLKTKKTFDWQDKKAIEDLITKQQNLQKEMEQLQEKHQELIEKKDKFDKSSERIAEKNKLLQQLMNEMLDEETKKMYAELNKLLQEKGKEMEIKDLVEKIKNKEENLEKELDRALEMFKEMKMESKMEDITQKLEELAKKQDEIAQKSDQKKSDAEELKKEQMKLNEEFIETQKDINELEKMNEEMENKKQLEDTQKQEEEISKDQQDSKESLDKNDKKSAAKSQKNAANALQKMAEKMKKQQEDSESKENEENIDDLRNILENLITLSYDQEEVMKEFKKVNQQDPRFITLSQQQLKIKDDSKIIEDSLQALAKRVFQIQSFITRELEDMNKHMNEASKAIKARRSDVAAGKQQFAMTSMNNLALLLSDVLKQMQQQSQDQKQGSGSCKKKKKGKSGSPSMGQLQKKLNKQIEDLQKSGMSGQKLSQELAKLARQQAQIRNAMKNEQGKGGMGGNGSGKDGENGKPNSEGGKDGKGENGNEPGNGGIEKIIKEMEKTEADLVNKQITQQTLDRQQEILSRLLEHENAQRERELDTKRESQSGIERNKKMPPSFEQYLKDKQKQVEMLKTIAPGFSPYYKKESSEYLQKLNN